MKFSAQISPTRSRMSLPRPPLQTPGSPLPRGAFPEHLPAQHRWVISWPHPQGLQSQRSSSFLPRPASRPPLAPLHPRLRAGIVQTGPWEGACILTVTRSMLLLPDTNSQGYRLRVLNSCCVECSDSCAHADSSSAHIHPMSRSRVSWPGLFHAARCWGALLHSPTDWNAPSFFFCSAGPSNTA